MPQKVQSFASSHPLFGGFVFRKLTKATTLKHNNNLAFSYDAFHLMAVPNAREVSSLERGWLTYPADCVVQFRLSTK
jgi:hypothetical protein